MQSQARAAVDTNSAYYNSLPLGLEDYWNKMAAPRFRTETLCRLVLDSKATTLVELGCGNGRLLMELGERGFQGKRVGVDLSDKRIALNKELAPHIEWHAANLDVPANFSAEQLHSFEAVVAAELIEHVDDPAMLLRNAAALAIPGTGQLFLSTQSGRIGPTEKLVGHQRHFTTQEIKTLLEATGWDSVSVWNAGFPFHDLSKWIAGLRPGSTVDRFSTRAYGPLEKLVCWVLRFLFLFNSQSRGAQLFAIARAKPR